MYVFTHDCLKPNWERDRALKKYRHFLKKDQLPTMDYVMEFSFGGIGQAVNPLYLMDLVIHPNYSDASFEEMGIMQLAFMHFAVCDEFALQRGMRVWAYDAMGPVYDGKLSTFATDGEHQAMSWINEDRPYELDGWDAWTIVADLMKLDYLTLWEKVPTWSEANKKQECSGCHFFDAEHRSCTIWGGSERMFERICPFPTHGQKLPGYRRVQPEQMASADFKHLYIPCYERSKESPLFRAKQFVQVLRDEGDVRGYVD